MEATIVSLLPYPFKDSKPQLFPAEFYIKPVKDGKFEFIVLGDATRGVYLDHDRGSEHMVVPAAEIAKSLVDDYVISQPLQDQEAGPGLFWVSGRYTREEIEAKLGKQLKEARESQRRWFVRLVHAADDLWIANHQYRQLSDLDRLACRELGLKRDWLSDDPAFIYKCPVCTTLISKDAVVCFACHVVLKPEELGKFQFLGGTPAGSVQALNAK